LAKKNNSTTANLGFEEKLWAAADKLRGHIDPSEYKHTVLGLIFLKYISDRFSAHREKLQTEMADPDSILKILVVQIHPQNPKSTRCNSSMSTKFKYS
jgi:type I restriction-modification system DNA methylase subunit